MDQVVCSALTKDHGNNFIFLPGQHSIILVLWKATTGSHSWVPKPPGGKAPGPVFPGKYKNCQHQQEKISHFCDCSDESPVVLFSETCRSGVGLRPSWRSQCCRSVVACIGVLQPGCRAQLSHLPPAAVCLRHCHPSLPPFGNRETLGIV